MKTIGFLLSFIGIILIVYHTVKLFRERKLSVRGCKSGGSAKVSELLDVLQSGSNARSKAWAFIALMQSSYVYVHVLGNKGNNYDDEIQSKSFCNTLSRERIQMIRNLGD